ncbi:diuretic hormone receptor-like protein [Leptotrombidium deliense]|uniref:Diuretic hormone receptor-like protein n=1 Tax=Leptotrombidium deliense TaxID=299467 RepID=A0A443RYG8_9ACAR|nr:diuretic hormone receptor-like protein [Leptotrombidium deliense]
MLNNSRELDCILGLYNQSLYQSSENLKVFCEQNWDGASCWPSTPADQIVVLPCFSEFNKIKYDTSRKLLQPLYLFTHT